MQLCSRGVTIYPYPSLVSTHMHCSRLTTCKSQDLECGKRVCPAPLAQVSTLQYLPSKFTFRVQYGNPVESQYAQSGSLPLCIQTQVMSPTPQTRWMRIIFRMIFKNSPPRGLPHPHLKIPSPVHRRSRFSQILITPKPLPRDLPHKVLPHLQVQTKTWRESWRRWRNSRLNPLPSPHSKIR